MCEAFLLLSLFSSSPSYSDSIPLPQTLSEDEWDYELQEYTSLKNKLTVALEWKNADLILQT